MGQQATRRVLILTGSDPNFPGFSVLTRNIQSILRDRSRDRVELLYELQQSLTIDPQSEDSDKQLISYLKRSMPTSASMWCSCLWRGDFACWRRKITSLFAGIPKIFYDFDDEREATNRSRGT